MNKIKLELTPGEVCFLLECLHDDKEHAESKISFLEATHDVDTEKAMEILELQHIRIKVVDSLTAKIEDAYDSAVGDDAYAEYVKDGKRSYTLEQMWEELGLTDADLVNKE